MDKSSLSRRSARTPVIAVLIPCYNEALTVAKVVRDFQRALPEAEIYVFDNNSRDATALVAREAGAIVVREKRQGKGFVVASMLERVDADYFIMVDGDDTYPADAAHRLLAPLFRGEADMVVGQRLSTFADKSFRPLHVFGNKLVRGLVNLSFGARLTDIMSGYRAFTRDVAERLPVVAFGFDIETEMTLQLLYRRFVIAEVPIAYGERPDGSSSKLRTFHDGARVLLKLLGIVKAYKPLTFFGALGLAAFLVGAVVGAFPVVEFVETGYISRVPSAMLAASCMILSALLISIGVVLHTLNFRILEMTNVLGKQIGRVRHRERLIRPARAVESLPRVVERIVERPVLPEPAQRERAAAGDDAATPAPTSVAASAAGGIR